MAVMRRPGETICREECPNGHETHPAWALCAECGAELVDVEYVPAANYRGAVEVRAAARDLLRLLDKYDAEPVVAVNALDRLRAAVGGQ